MHGAHRGGWRCSSETETAVATPTRSSDFGEDVTQAVARLGGAAGADDQPSIEDQRCGGAPAHAQQLAMTAGAYDSGGPAAVDNTTPTMLGVAVVAHKGGRKNKKDLPRVLKREISIWICKKSVDLC
ncbi:hypothetical protein Scep_012222 [Stephania cephalantha]|uniref:Uncharacterized protein n=1 Tax=Stephania cephalantha TaxID=152367 RepID=A0AAP0JES8_9MAGN